MAGCGADTEANLLIQSLTGDATFPIPNVDLTGPDFVFPPGLLQQSPSKLEPKDVTDGHVDGPGIFDAFMRGFKAHLEEEFNANRITGDDYTKAYIALTESAMAQGVNFLLGKDQAYWQALATQVQAFAGRVQLETAKIQLAAVQFEASNQKANYALTKMKLSTESSDYCTSEFNLTQILPVQKQLLDVQKAGQDIANDTATYNLANNLPKQVENLGYQGEMLKEQTEAQRAQTLDTRKDGAPVVGVLGKQKQLYDQQITSYQRDSELKAARIWSDAWITQKTIDEGLLPPAQFENAAVDTVLSTIRTKNNLG